MEATLNNYSQVQSQVSKTTCRYMKEFGVSRKEAYTAAAEEVGKAMTPPMSAAELNSWLARERNATRYQKAQEEPRAAKREPAPKTEKSVAATYRVWCLEHDFVAPDAALAHFNGHTAAAFGTARARLKEEGFEFERVESGWRITARPAPKAEPKPVTEDEVRGVVSSAMSAAMGPLLEAVTRDVMAKLSLG